MDYEAEAREPVNTVSVNTSPVNAAPRIELHIGLLVVEGLPVEAGDAAAIQGEVEAELSRLLAAGNVITASRVDAGIRGPDLRLQHGTTPADLGRRAGAAIFGGISA